MERLSQQQSVRQKKRQEIFKAQEDSATLLALKMKERGPWARNAGRAPEAGNSLPDSKQTGPPSHSRKN